MTPIAIALSAADAPLTEPFVAVAVAADADLDTAALPFSATVADRLRAEAKAAGFRGKVGQTVRVSGEGDTRWVAIVGLGDSPGVSAWRRAGCAAVRGAEAVRAPSAALAGLQDAAAVRAAAEGAALAAWRFDTYRTPDADDPPVRLESLRLSVAGDAGDALRQANAHVAGVCLARQVANEPPNVCTPTWLAEQAVAVAERHGLEATILDEQDIHERGLRLLEAVGRGSAEESRLIHLVWRPAGEIRRKVALVGKGLTFDSGGYSLKPPNAQIDMHLDMGGAAAVLGAAEAIGSLKPSGVEVHFIIPAAENLVSGNAYKVMDIIEAYNGVKVEIHNTDAEGRLVLADAISWAAEHGPDEIIDLATLTGSCVVALGNETAGLFTDHAELAEGLLAAAEAADERLWRLPLVDRIRKQLDSHRADIRNVGSRWGGAISAALFLQRFAGDVPWAHIDVAGPAMTEEPWEYINRGGTGYGVLLLAAYVQALSGADA